MVKIINKFYGEYRFLSNFYDSPIMYFGATYATVEHAFQAAKTLDEVERKEVREQPTPGKAKRAGGKVTLRDDWEERKVMIMRGLVLQKFANYPKLRKKILETGDAELIEGNTWNDTFWGVCDGVGENRLGKILMSVREGLARYERRES